VSGLHAVPGLRVGHWTHASGTTGCTAIVAPAGARAGVCVAGHAPGSRELSAVDPTHLAGGVHAVMLSGGSAFGLATADGAMQVLSQRGIGFAVGEHTVPIVPAAILFDLSVGEVRPDAAAGRAAVEAALDHGGPLAEGRVGAGAGGRVGKAWGHTEPGGFGGASVVHAGSILAVGVAVNAFGAVRDPDTGAWVRGGPASPEADPTGSPWRENTTLAVVATDAALTPAGCKVLAQMATAGMARALDPAFTPFDGDIVFALSTGEGAPVEPAALMGLGREAARLLGRAIVRAVDGT
jgi:L-aminopeptidase/D-esterase-like protein